MSVNRIASDGTLRFAALHLGLFCLPLSHKKDARLIYVNVLLSCLLLCIYMYYACLTKAPGKIGFTNCVTLSVGKPKSLLTLLYLHLSLVMRKPTFCICENKDADQLRSNCAANQRLCFRYTDSTITLLPKFEISSLYSHFMWLYSPVCVGPGRKPRRPVFSERGSYLLAMVIH